MVLPADISIKEEKADFELDSTDYLSPELEVTVKVEVESSHVTQWEIKNEFTIEGNSDVLESDCGNPEDFSVIEYEELIECARLKCRICNEQFYERYSLLRHNLEHLRLLIKPLHQCPLCFHYFPTKSELLKHNISTHKINKASDNEDLNVSISKSLHKCKICGKTQTYKNWHSHMKEVHSTDEFECAVCNSVFKCARYLRKHFFKIHLNKKFKGYLQTESSELKCNLCPAVLRCKNALKTHTRNCHSEKAQCPICKSVLKSQSYLNTHLRRVHYNDGKDHKCFCGKKFKSPRYLKVHKKNAHSR